MGFQIHIVQNRESNQCVKIGVLVLPCDPHFVLMHKYQHNLSTNPSLDPFYHQDFKIVALGLRCDPHFCARAQISRQIVYKPKFGSMWYQE
jgi:hypothetical protein